MKTKLLLFFLLIPAFAGAQILPLQFDTVKHIRAGKYVKSYFNGGDVFYNTNQAKFQFNKPVLATQFRTVNDTMQTKAEARADSTKQYNQIITKASQQALGDSTDNIKNSTTYNAYKNDSSNIKKSLRTANNKDFFKPSTKWFNTIRMKDSIQGLSAMIIADSRYDYTKELAQQDLERNKSLKGAFIKFSNLGYERLYYEGIYFYSKGREIYNWGTQQDYGLNGYVRSIRMGDSIIFAPAKTPGRNRPNLSPLYSKLTIYYSCASNMGSFKYKKGNGNWVTVSATSSVDSLGYITLLNSKMISDTLLITTVSDSVYMYGLEYENEYVNGIKLLDFSVGGGRAANTASKFKYLKRYLQLNTVNQFHIMSGVNDLSDNHNNGVTAYNAIKTLIDTLNVYRPYKSDIIIHNLYDKGKYPSICVGEDSVNVQYHLMNDSLLALSRRSNYSLIDLNTAFGTPANRCNLALMGDGIHPNINGSVYHYNMILEAFGGYSNPLAMNIYGKFNENIQHKPIFLNKDNSFIQFVGQSSNTINSYDSKIIWIDNHTIGVVTKDDYITNLYDTLRISGSPCKGGLYTTSSTLPSYSGKWLKWGGIFGAPNMRWDDTLRTQNGKIVLDNGKITIANTADNGLYVYTPNNISINASSTTGNTITANSSSGNAGYFTSSSGSGVVGISSSANGLYGSSSTSNGVYGTTTSGTGVYGISSSGIGLIARTTTNLKIAQFAKRSGTEVAYTDTSGHFHGSKFYNSLTNIEDSSLITKKRFIDSLIAVNARIIANSFRYTKTLDSTITWTRTDGTNTLVFSQAIDEGYSNFTFSVYDNSLSNTVKIDKYGMFYNEGHRTFRDNTWVTDKQYVDSVSNHCLKKFYTDISTSGTGETDLYSDTIKAGQLARNGDEIKFEVEILCSNITGGYIKLYFAGSSIQFMGSTTTDSYCNVRFTVIRVSSTVCRVTVTGQWQSNLYTSYAEFTSKDFTIDNIIKVTGQCATNSMTAKTGSINYSPANLY